MVMIHRLFVFLMLAVGSTAVAEPVAVARHEMGPWPVVSRLIGYGDRIWFANSVKGGNHNSADLYSIPLEGGGPRYEGHLFSQDAGDPVVHQGLLYWPLEDARTEPGIGAFDVTDGVRWEHGLIPTEQAFHVHAMIAAGERLYAAPSAWKASIARSEDGGASWSNVYLHPTPERRVSRITGLATMGDRVIGVLNAPDGQRLIRVDDGSGRPLSGWPEGRRTVDLVTHRDTLFGLVAGRGGREIWRSDGEVSALVWRAPEAWVPAALASDGEHLWMAGVENGAASLWTSPDARGWTEVAKLGVGDVFDMAVHRGVIAIGGCCAGDQGVLWVVRSGVTVDTVAREPAWPRLDGPSSAGADIDWDAKADALDQRLADPETYRGYGEPLKRAILDLPREGVPPDFYPDRFDAPMPEDPLPMFGDIILDQMSVMGRWHLYWGMGLARSGKVDPADILRPWDYAPNGPAKHFSTPEIAIWAAGRLGRRDPDVLNALVRRLEDQATPLWLKGDAAGALTRLTGQRHGYDARAWRRWLGGPS